MSSGSVPTSSHRVSDAFPHRKRTGVHTKDTAKSSISKETPVDPARKELDILEQFDLTLEYGPCIGITRMERWERAEKHGLNPPTKVKNIISRHADDETYTKCLWNDYNTLK